MSRFGVDQRVVRRDVHRGKVWSAQALRVLQDDQDGLVTACWPGAPSLAATSWVQSMVSGNNAWRGQGVEALAAGNWTLDTWTWQRTGLLMWHQSDLWFSINSFYDAGTGQQQCWYVNFQLPYRRTALGFDTFDLFLDLVVTPDLTQWKWKDEDEYAQARRVGVVTDAIHHRVEHAREQALSMIRSYHGPFRPDRRRPVWSPDPSWSLPDLPRGVLHTP